MQRKGLKKLCFKVSLDVRSLRRPLRYQTMPVTYISACWFIPVGINRRLFWAQSTEARAQRPEGASPAKDGAGSQHSSQVAFWSWDMVYLRKVRRGKRLPSTRFDVSSLRSKFHFCETYTTVVLWCSRLCLSAKSSIPGFLELACEPLSFSHTHQLFLITAGSPLALPAFSFVTASQAASEAGPALAVLVAFSHFPPH